MHLGPRNLSASFRKEDQGGIELIILGMKYHVSHPEAA